MKTVKLSITLPKDLVDQMKNLTTNISSFIAAGMREYVSREQSRRAIKESAGAWSDENHPELLTVVDVEKYVREVRSTWRRAEH
ncbi:type II toxin-antitoxin system CcdA family antitoxin [Desulfofundulus thermocisternus]|uniref:type II toxin-antitoxin system CcdA family antitoxin n=1 Tax=Desulfofundulus thermocisternus TaxID=42471 RepID=UPI001A03FAE1|nr:type II toxin-antitoxin system CcdA family antitoxin [Desulfofundulus thermocisternus]MBE3586872.1 type II toxin-antitoxin system CcdA family antitoxin [Thermoanaerobacter sp.]MCS5695440.1 type II toxin-antitoxin system CcdA family antitoxin [Desulfofundulus thermocisternus]